MVNIRRATPADMREIQNCNLTCLPENYQLKYYLYHIMSWPGITWVAEDHKGKIVGYVLAKMDDESNDEINGHGHLTSVATFRTHRKLGISTRLMDNVHSSMLDLHNAEKVSLHVRESNEAAKHLYRDKNNYELSEIEHGYYADGEDAHAMTKTFPDDQRFTTGLYVYYKPTPAAADPPQDSGDGGTQDAQSSGGAG